MPKRIKLLIALNVVVAGGLLWAGATKQLSQDVVLECTALPAWAMNTLLAVWAVLGAGSVVRRVSLFAAASILCAAIPVGTMVVQSQDLEMDLQVLPPFVFAPAIAAFAIAAIARHWSGLHLVRSAEPSKERGTHLRFSLRTFMLVTLMIAAACALRPYLDGTEAEGLLGWLDFCMSVGVMLGPIGLLAPIAVWVMLSHGNVLKRLTVGAILSLAAALQSAYFSQSDDLEGLVTVSIAGAVVYALQCLALWAVRSSGYRIAWSTADESAEDESSALEPAMA